MLLWALTRLVTAVLVIGAPGIRALGAYNDDVELYLLWAQQIRSGSFPINDPMWQYPPLAGAVFVAASLISPHSIMGFVLLALVADAVVLKRLVSAVRNGNALTGLTLWACAPVLIGPVMLGRFDIFPACVALIALMSLPQRPAAAGSWLAIGAAMKVWPAFVLVAVRRSQCMAAFAATLAISTVVMALIPGATSFLRFQEDRGIQLESVWALPYLVAKSFGWQIDTPYRYGAREVAGPLSAHLPAISAALTVAALLAIWWMSYRGRLSHMSTADIAFVAVLFSVALSRVISPQYAVWLIAIACVCLSSQSALKRVIHLVLWWSALGFALYPFLYDGLRNGLFISVLVQVARTALLVIACAEAVAVMRRTASVIDFPDHSPGSRPSSIDLRRAAGVSHVHDSNTHDRPAAPMA